MPATTGRAEPQSFKRSQLPDSDPSGQIWPFSVLPVIWGAVSRPCEPTTSLEKFRRALLAGGIEVCAQTRTGLKFEAAGVWQVSRQGSAGGAVNQARAGAPFEAGLDFAVEPARGQTVRLWEAHRPVSAAISHRQQ